MKASTCSSVSGFRLQAITFCELKFLALAVCVDKSIEVELVVVTGGILRDDEGT